MTSCEYVGLATLRLVAVVLTLALAMLLCIESSFPQENGETPEEGRQRLERIAEEIAKKVKRYRGARAGAYGARLGVITEVPPDALKEPRGQTEDELRMYLLAGVSSGKPYDEMREVLNRPWNKDTVRALWELDDKQYEIVGRGLLWGETLPLLVFAANRHKGEVLIEVRSILERLFSEPFKPNSRNLGSCTDLDTALIKHGTLEVLPDSFWTAVQQEYVGKHVIHVLGWIGSKETVEWLEKFQETCTWENQQALKKAIDRLKNKLARKETGERHGVDQVRQPETLENKPSKAKNEFSPPNSIRWFVSTVVIAAVVLAGVVVFLLLRRKK